MALKVGPINAASPTPLMPDGSLDAASVRRLADRWARIGLDGVMVLGTMGEGRFLAEAARDAMVEHALAATGDRLTVYVAVADLSRERMIERVRKCARQGVPCAVLCLPPGVSLPKAVEDVKAVADASPIPCAYYDIPANTGTTLVPVEILDILRHPNIHLLKDSSGFAFLAQALTDSEWRPEGKKLLDGTEYRIAHTRWLGYDGLLSGGAALTGRLMRKVWDLAGAGDIAAATALDRTHALCLMSVYNRFHRPLQNIAGQKYALKVLGVFAHEALVADQRLSEQDRSRVEAAVEKYRLWLE